MQLGLGATIGISPGGAAATILVVDDNEHNREILSRRLMREGHRVRQAQDGRRALDVMRREPVDTVLLDLMMPVMDGYETLAEIKRDPALRHVPIIVITAVDEMEGAVRCIEQGAEDYVGKPVDQVLLRARLRACLNKKRLHDLEKEHRREIERQNQTLEERVRQQVREVSSTQLAAIFAMSKLAESKDPETGEHLERMREYCVVLSRELGRQPAFAGVITPEFHDNIYAARATPLWTTVGGPLSSRPCFTRTSLPDWCCAPVKSGSR
jgi:response regulator RpfG family c-di-GMP phosphodiesterase